MLTPPVSVCPLISLAWVSSSWSLLWATADPAAQLRKTAGPHVFCYVPLERVTLSNFTSSPSMDDHFQEFGILPLALFVAESLSKFGCGYWETLNRKGLTHYWDLSRSQCRVQLVCDTHFLRGLEFFNRLLDLSLHCIQKKKKGFGETCWQLAWNDVCSDINYIVA